MSKRRVVVTGLGVVSPLGSQLEPVWAAILAGKSGIRLIESFDTETFTTKIAGVVTDFDVTQYLSEKDARKCDLFVQYGIGSAIQAIQQSGLKEFSGLDLDRVGVSIGSGIGGIGTIENNHGTLLKSGPRRISPFFIPASIINMAAGHVSILHGFRGPNLAMATACTTGTHSIGLGARCIAHNDADVMVVGGAEQACTPLGIGGFAAARAMSTRNDAPEKASRPWDKNRDGFVLADGAACLVLEELEHAKRRGAPIIAELLGFGMSSDAFHITRPAEGGKGAALAMQNALRDAGLAASEINYINAHATSTPVGDSEEVQAINSTFGAHAKRIPISSTKSMTGHLCGAAGAIEALFTVLAIRDQVAPPTINLDEPDEGFDLDFVPHVARPHPIRVALSNSFGFGGTNGTLVFTRYED